MLAPALVLTAAAALGPVKLATPGFTCTGIAAERCAAWVDRFGLLLGQEGVFITTAKESRERLGAEQVQKFLACDDVPDCVQAHGVALGVDGTLTGTLQWAEGVYFVTLKVIRSKDATTWVSATTDRMQTDVALEAFLDATARDFYSRLFESLSTPAGTRWTPGIVGGVLVLGGGGLLLWGQSEAQALGRQSPPPVDLAQQKDGAQLKQTLGLVGVGVGAVGLLWSIVWNVATPSAPAQAALVPAPGGGVVVVVGGAL